MPATSSAGFEDRGDRIDMQFENGARASADLMIGADGIHSTVRHLLFGPEAPRYSGGIAYRGLIPAERVRHLDIEVTTQIWMGPHRHVVVYFVAGKRYLNFVANADRDASTLESWAQQGDPDELRATYAGWDPKLGVILDAVTETFMLGHLRARTAAALVGRPGDAARRCLSRHAAAHGAGRGAGGGRRRDAGRLPAARRRHPAGLGALSRAASAPHRACAVTGGRQQGAFPYARRA